MIQGIRKRFILIAMAVLSVTMIGLAAVINFSNWVNVRQEIRETVDNLTEGQTDGARMRGKRTRHLQNTLDESRYFSVRITSAGEIISLDLTRVSGISEEEAGIIVRTALRSGKDSGMTGDYSYQISAGQGVLRTAVFLDCETKMTGLRRLLLISAFACAGGIGLAWLLVALFSGRAIRPMIRSAVQQKQFITDAGHELKTPLTVIAANMDVLELEKGQNEWIDSTRDQLERMKTLVNDLIYLSRLDEDQAMPDREILDLSALAEAEAETFRGLMKGSGKELKTRIQPHMMVRGDRSALRKMMNQLLENAMKYAPEGDRVLFSLTCSGRVCELATENGLKVPIKEEELPRLFDRFYRPDASRSQESGGYGIGLSMVRSIAEKHGGSARAENRPQQRIRFSCQIPVEKSESRP